MMEQKKGAADPRPGVQDWKRTLRSLLPQIDDPEALAQAVLEIQEELEVVIYEGVQALRAEGHSYESIARPFGISRQGARWRWPDPGVDPNAYRRPADAPRRRALPAERLARSMAARPPKRANKRASKFTPLPPVDPNVY